MTREKFIQWYKSVLAQFVKVYSNEEVEYNRGYNQAIKDKRDFLNEAFTHIEEDLFMGDSK